MRSFRNTFKRYLAVYVLGLIAAGLLYWLSGLLPAIQKASTYDLWDASAVLKVTGVNTHNPKIEDNGICTATIVARVSGGYEALTAAHCIDVSPTGAFSVYFDEGMREYTATVDYKGDAVKGYDVAFLHVITSSTLHYVPLGSFKSLKIGNPVAFVGWAGGIGLQYFHGYVSKIPGLQYGMQPLFDPVMGINWTYDIAVDAGGGVGASGAGLFDINSGTIVGTMNGYASNDSADWFFALPQGSNKIKNFKEPF